MALFIHELAKVRDGLLSRPRLHADVQHPDSGPHDGPSATVSQRMGKAVTRNCSGCFFAQRKKQGRKFVAKSPSSIEHGATP